VNQDLASAHEDLPAISETTSSMERMEGFFPLYWDGATGKIWMEIPRFDEDFLYAVSQPAGLGSNDVGLDRTQLGDERVVRFERIGPKILLTQPNLQFRASSDNEAERASVREAFAGSIVWGFTAVAESDGAVLVDATGFVVRDAHGVIRSLRDADQGDFELDSSRSAVHPSSTRGFPDNTEMEARLTFRAERPGSEVRAVAADPYAVTLRVRHSFVRLPDAGYEPRRFDPRAGYSAISFKDYSAPIGEEMEQRFIARHRIEVGENGQVSEPITYYLDPGTPEPVRSALLEGARWWEDAFDAAGLPGAFQVEMLPPDADPMDVRYNVIQWVHRATRGWSYGTRVTDPRTGEIIKGHVLLGSLRIRQDYLIAEGLLSPYSGEAAQGYPADADPMLEMALARVRQLSAHEVGHTLGLAHNFAASADGRESVMDYPAPLVTTAGDSVSLANAYAVGLGAWDRVAIRYGYAEFPDEVDERAALQDVLEAAHRGGLRFITDEDARAGGGAHPFAALWDNGADPVEDLRRELDVRATALERFGTAAIREGRPLAQIEEVLVPLYLRHRYQVDGTAKAIGGVEYAYALRGDAQPPPAPVPGPVQRAAVDALLECVTPETLSLPSDLRMNIPPRPPGYDQHRELFGGYTGPTFDPYAPAEIATAIVFEALLQPERAARLAYQSDFDEELPELSAVLDRATDKIWKRSTPQDPYEAELFRIVQQVWVDQLMALAIDRRAAPAVQGRTAHHLRVLHTWLDEHPPSRDEEELAHREMVVEQLGRFLYSDLRPPIQREDLTVPPGSPIGSPPEFLQRVEERRWQIRAASEH
jgi:hypothetical protein